jgi:hypothetical protein
VVLKLTDDFYCFWSLSTMKKFHILVHLRLKHPTKHILMTKVNWKPAYRRCHLNLDTAIQCCTHLDDLLLLPTRLTFGGTLLHPTAPRWTQIWVISQRVMSAHICFGHCVGYELFPARSSYLDGILLFCFLLLLKATDAHGMPAFILISVNKGFDLFF